MENGSEGKERSGVIWRRNLWGLLFSQFVAMVGISAAFPLLPLYVRTLGVSTLESAQRWAALIHSAPFIIAIFMTPIWGAIADRYGYKLMVLRAIAGLTLVTFLMAVVQSVEQLLAVRLLQGALTGFVAAALALISAGTPTRHAGYAISMHQASISAGVVLGPFLGGFIADFIEIRAVFFFVSALCAVSFCIVLLFIQEPQKKEQTVTAKGSKLLFENLRFGFQNRKIRVLLGLIILAQAGIVLTMPIFPYYLESLGAPQQWLGMITGMMLGLSGLCLTIMAPYWGRLLDRSGPKTVLQRGIPIGAGAMALQALVPSYLWIAPLRILIGSALAGILPTFYTMLNRLIPQERKAGGMSIGSSATLLGNLLGPVACGQIAPLLGMRSCFLVSALVMLLVLLLFFAHHAE